MHFNNEDLNFEEINQQYTQNEAERLLATKETTRKKRPRKTKKLKKENTKTRKKIEERNPA